MKMLFYLSLVLFSGWSLTAYSNSILRVGKGIAAHVSKASGNKLSHSKHLRIWEQYLSQVRTKSSLMGRSKVGEGEELIIGIDLGTTNSVVSVIHKNDGSLEVLKNNLGNTTVPSVVSFDESGNVLSVGEDALENATFDPDNTISSVKRFIGLNHDEAATELSLGDIPYQIVAGADGKAVVQLSGGKQIAPEEVSAEVLKHLKEMVSSTYPNAKIKGVVITYPERFNSKQREVTQAAAKLAGFEEITTINEPSAAAITYGLNKGKDGEKVFVVDIGGGTTDMAILEITDNNFEVLGTGGKTTLGGDNIDEKFSNFLLGKVENNANFKLGNESVAELRAKARNAKHSLSNSDSDYASIIRAFSESGQSKQAQVKLKITRAEFDEIITDFVDEASAMVEELLAKDIAYKKPPMTSEDIDKVVFVGGTTRNPLLRDRISKIFPDAEKFFVDPDEAISTGAARYGESFFSESGGLHLGQNNNIPIGIKVESGEFVVIYPEGKSIPGEEFKDGFTTARDMQDSIEVQVFQGTRARADDNTELDTFRVEDILPAKRGDNNFGITFKVDEKGILSIEVKDMSNNRITSHTVKKNVKLTQEQLDTINTDKLVNSKKYEEYEALDEAFKQALKVYNELDNIIAVAKNTLQKHADKISETSSKEVNDMLKKVEDLSPDNSSAATLKKALDELKERLPKLSKEIRENSN